MHVVPLSSDVFVEFNSNNPLLPSTKPSLLLMEEILHQLRLLSFFMFFIIIPLFTNSFIHAQAVQEFLPSSSIPIQLSVFVYPRCCPQVIEGHLDDDGVAWLTFELIPQHRISADNLAPWWCFFLLHVFFRSGNRML